MMKEYKSSVTMLRGCRRELSHKETTAADAARRLSRHLVELADRLASEPGVNERGEDGCTGREIDRLCAVVVATRERHEVLEELRRTVEEHRA